MEAMTSILALPELAYLLSPRYYFSSEHQVHSNKALITKLVSNAQDSLLTGGVVI